MDEMRKFDALLTEALAEACWQECRRDWEAEEDWRWLWPWAH